jgi:hypothetical protein
VFIDDLGMGYSMSHKTVDISTNLAETTPGTPVDAELEKG